MPAGYDATENSCPALMPHVTANGDIDGHHLEESIWLLGCLQ